MKTPLLKPIPPRHYRVQAEDGSVHELTVRAVDPGRDRKALAVLEGTLTLPRWSPNKILRESCRFGQGCQLVLLDGQLVGYLVWLARRKDRCVLRLRGLYPEASSLLLAWLKDRTPPRPISFPCRERDLERQQFLKLQDFRCTKILENFYDGPKEPAYLFRWEPS